MKMDDEGSLMIEMSLITPVLIGVVFVVINLFVIVMNYSVAAGEAYTVLYNREEYRRRVWTMRFSEILCSFKVL